MLLQKRKTEFPIWGEVFGNFLANEPLNCSQNFREVYGSIPAANIKENENEFQIELAVPGKKKEDFKIDVKEKILSVSSESKTANVEKEEKFTRKEFSYETFKRSFKLPEVANAELIGAMYSDGILKISIPKKDTKHDTIKSITVS